MEEVDVCQQCGDKGFPEALNYCKKCQVYPIHRYCLSVLPKKLNEYVTWSCEDCETKELPRMKSEVKVRKKGFVIGKKEEEEKVKRKKNDIMISITKTEAPVGQSSPPPVQAPEARCSDKNKDSTLERPGEQVREDAAIHGKIIIADDISKEKVKNDVMISITNTEAPVGQSRPPPVQAPELRCGDKNEDSTLEWPGEQVREDAAIHGKITTTDDMSNFLEQNYLVAQPIVDPVWKGSLRFWNESFRNDCLLVAHMSSLACFKVYEEAKSLPEILSVELLHRCDVWPKGFETFGPTGQSIALYFFPEEKRSEKAFDFLITAMMNKDLAMRAVLKNAELLIFTSSMLPMQYWRFQAKYYLWGVFCGKKASEWRKNVASQGKDLAESLTHMRCPITPSTSITKSVLSCLGKI